MASVPESSASYPVGVYQLETTDPVLGGSLGQSNLQAKDLANRTAYLKAHVDTLESTVATQGSVLSVLQSDLNDIEERVFELENKKLHIVSARRDPITGSIDGQNPVILTSEVIDTENEYDIATGIFTASEAGYYQINANGQISYDTLPGNVTVLVAVKKNGSTVDSLGFTEITVTSANQSYPLSTSKIYYLESGDTVDLVIIQDAAYSFASHLGMNIHRVN